MIWMKDGTVVSYVLGIKVKVMTFEMVSLINRHTTALKLQN